MSNKNVTVTLQQQADYRFAICFDEAMPSANSPSSKSFVR
jgi:hypothetical protein